MAPNLNASMFIFLISLTTLHQLLPWWATHAYSPSVSSSLSSSLSSSSLASSSLSHSLRVPGVVSYLLEAFVLTPNSTVNPRSLHPPNSACCLSLRTHLVLRFPASLSSSLIFLV
ncbi:hypothetical protein FA13DRAFT_59075 [Coprinellus micaceus]|uniref:REJ domain-containing protein n=1 Tax=Coprinellus micaceus TaxID=71717 RepID=A0A4Y7U2X8_COPMI|nr:hypothetical protein FA13DRAFT_59075 [Coprinellus micaceus]